MNKPFTLIIGSLLFAIFSYAQDPIDVTEQTIKIGGLQEEELLFGFAEGDKIIFNFQEANNKELKEIEIVEYPNNSRFSDFKTKKAEKTITANKQGVYIFRFKNSAIAGRICKVKIQRVPASEGTRNFNSTITWIMKQDTIWNTYTKDVIIGHDTTYIQNARKELLKIDTIISPLFDKTLRVHSETAVGKTQYTYAPVELPKNTYHPNQFNPYKSIEVIAWSYWLGVGEKSKEDYEKANKRLAIGVEAIGTLAGYGPLATLVATGISVFGNTDLGDNVRYKFYGFQKGNEVIIDYGNVVSAFGRNEKIKQGAFTVELYNDNFMDGIDVHLKMVVMQISKTWEDVQFTEQKVTPRMEKQLFKEPSIRTSRMPIAGL